jgi:hypothetical protein
MSEIKNNLPHCKYRNTTYTTTSDNYGTESVGTKISQTTDGLEPINYGTIDFSTVVEFTVAKLKKRSTRKF